MDEELFKRFKKSMEQCDNDLHKAPTIEDVKKLMEDVINRYEQNKDMKCLWTGVKPGTPMSMSCPCRKCSTYS